jgi:hypothetical protein
VSAVSSAGAILWTYPAGAGPDNVVAADLNGDGLDEVVIASMTGGGLDVLDSQGHPLWRAGTSGAGVNVSVGDANGDGAVEVVSAGGGGGVEVYEGKTGALLPAVGPRQVILALAVHSAPGSPSATRMVVEEFSASVVTARVTMTGLSATGATTWTVEDLGGIPGSQGASARTRPWVAVAAGSDGIYVIDAERGAIIASAGNVSVMQVTWLEWSGGTEPLLALAGPQGLEVYRVTGSGSAPPTGGGP